MEASLIMYGGIRTELVHSKHRVRVRIYHMLSAVHNKII